MCVDSHGYCRSGGAGMEVVDGMHVGQNQGLSTCQEIRKHLPNARFCTGDTRSHCRPDAQLWVGLSRNWSVFLERP